MKILDTDNFNERCDKILFYLFDIAKSEKDLTPLTHITKVAADLNINTNDPALHFLCYQINYIKIYTQDAHAVITSLGIAFISNSSFVKEQLKADTEGVLKWYETENAKQIFDDYPNVKRRAIRNEWIAILALIVSAIAIVLPLIYKKSG